MKKTFLILATLFSYVAISAQSESDSPLRKVFTPQMFDMSSLSLQVGLNATQYTGFYRTTTTAVDARVAYDFSKRCVFGIQANLFGAFSYNYADIIQRNYVPEPGDITPSSYPMLYNKNFSTMNFYLFNRIYVANNTHKRWGLYVATNVGAALIKLDVAPAQTYDITKFEPRPQGIKTGSQTVPTMGLGFGGHWKMGRFLGTPEVLMCIPLNETAYPYNYNPLPFHFQFNFGVGIPFAKRELEKKK